MELQAVKQRFGIIGNDEKLNRALEVAIQVAPTDISVLVIGESGAGKEFIPKVIHAMSARKHGSYIAVNCGAIPEGTIDSELFGHEKGSFTGANETRKGYFEVADKGTIFLDEVGELPMSTQARLLRILEAKEFMKVGSSKVQKTDVRVVAATNVNMQQAIKEGRFREDLYYRLNTVQISMPPLRERGNDILLLFKKFAYDFADRYSMPPIKIDDSAQKAILNYRWPGNVRQLKNIAEQISIIEENREITGNMIAKYLPQGETTSITTLVQTKNNSSDGSFASEREILYKILFDMKNDIAELKKEMATLLGPDHNAQPNNYTSAQNTFAPATQNSFGQHQFNSQDFANTEEYEYEVHPVKQTIQRTSVQNNDNVIDTEEVLDDNLSISASELELIKKALEKHKGKRKAAAKELGISERTLYRKLKEYDIR